MAQTLHILDATEKVNEAQKNVLFNKLCRYFGGVEALRGKTIALWGLSFKPNTDDMREAPSLVLIAALLPPAAKVRAYDPVASPKRCASCWPNMARRAASNADDRRIGREAAEGADALVLVTEWKEFRSPDFARLAHDLRGKAVFDGRNIYDPEAVAAAGLSYEGIGRISQERRP